MRYKAIIEYDGTAYCGYQIQDNADTVQTRLESALSELFGVMTKVTASGRTDTGVSARGQVVHFDADTSIPADKIPFAIEKLLPADISMLSCEETSDAFHARYDAISKVYSYSIYTGKVNKPLYSHCYRYIYNIDYELFVKVSRALIGKHDFKAFMSTGSSVNNTVRTIYSIDISRSGDIIKVEICGNGFLYNMVRIIIGTLLDISRGHLPADTIDRMLESGDRSLGGHTAPPQGLILEKVSYPENCSKNRQKV